MPKQQTLVTLGEASDMLHVSLNWMMNQALNPKFPKPKKIGHGRKKTGFFDFDEIEKWYMDNKKGLCLVIAQDAIRGKVWSVRNERKRT